MRLVRVSLACVLVMAVPFAVAHAQSDPKPSAPKPPEARTQLTPAQSPPLSFAQLRKQALSTAAASPAASPNAPMAGVKASPLSTSKPPDPALAGQRAAMNAAKLARVHADAAYAPMVKPAPVTTIGPATPARATAAAKRASASRTTASKAGAAHKLPALQSNTASPALSPAQLAKQKAAEAAARRQP
jgi:hypothetical protein